MKIKWELFEMYYLTYLGVLSPQGLSTLNEVTESLKGFTCSRITNGKRSNKPKGLAKMK